MTAGIGISEAAATVDLSSDTLRYYERDDLLLRPVPRSTSGHRRYDEADLRWIEMLTRLRAIDQKVMGYEDAVSRVQRSA